MGGGEWGTGAMQGTTSPHHYSPEPSNYQQENTSLNMVRREGGGGREGG